jgi:hypothetical protein
MTAFHVFGDRLEAPLTFPELREAPGSAAAWTLTIEPSGSAAARPEGDLLGEDTVYGTCMVRAYKRPDGGFSLVYDDTGRFDISVDGRRIVWWRPEEAVEEAARADVVSRVLAMAMHVNGILTLHASAIAVDSHGIAFFAPKFRGKSTLAAAMLRLGGKLITDDTLPIALERGEMLPGVHHLRLWGDSAGRTVGSDEAADAARKLLFSDIEEGQLQQTPVSIGALYVLVPQLPQPKQPLVRRERLTGIAATMSLVQHAKLAPLLRGQEAGTLFSQAASLASRVPVYALIVQRDLERLMEAATIVRSWHAPASARAHH